MENQFVGIFTIGQTLDRGIRLYRLALKKAVILFLVPGILCAYTSFEAFHNVTLVAQKNPFGFLTFSYCLNIIISSYVWVIATRYFFHLSRGSDLPLGQVIRLFKPKDLLYIITFSIVVIITALSFVALIIPFIYFSNLLYVATIIILIERRYFFGWLPRLFFLTKKRWWKTAGINCITFLIVFVPMMVVMIIISTLSFFSAAHAIQQPGMNSSPAIFSPAVSVTMGVLYGAIVALVTPLLQTVNIVFYNNLLVEKENIDLQQKLDAINGSPAQRI